MATMNISLPDDLREAVEREVKARRYTSASEYIRELLRNDLAAQPTMESLLAKIEEGLASEVAGEFDESFFDDFRKALREPS